MPSLKYVIELSAEDKAKLTDIVRKGKSPARMILRANIASIGCPDARFHDLRHSYAIIAIKSGDDIKTVQGNLGHATASFTLDVYGHVTEQMKKDSANRMEAFIKSVSNE